jgi:hypothetical protein
LRASRSGAAALESGRRRKAKARLGVQKASWSL